jgi:hypothetical protein
VKKAFASLVVFVVTVVLLSAGSVGFASTTEKQRVVLYNNKIEIVDALNRMAEDYNASHEGVELVVDTTGSDDYATTLKTRFAGGEEPDIFVITGTEQMMLWMEKLEDLTDQPWVSDMVDVAIPNISFEDKIYGFPVGIEGYGYMYNRDLFAKAGIDKLPTTLDELSQDVEKLKAIGVNYPFVNTFGSWYQSGMFFSECGVLLKNEGVLPLPKDRKLKVVVLGEAAVRPVFQGTGCAVVNAKNVDSPLEALKAALPLADIHYAPGYLADYSTTDTLLDEATRLAAQAEVAILMVASRLPCESDEYDRVNMDLESGHRQLIESVCRVQPNTVVVVCNGDAVEMSWADGANAILDMWYAGEGAGQAMADLLVGDVNPSGKLAVTIPKRLEDCPAWLDFPHEQDVGIYREGIFVGYRWYDTRRIEPMYPFGHGLSYTRFHYDRIDVTACDSGYVVHVTLTNVGNREGSEVVQLYVKPPKGALFRPEKELKAFAKVALKPGERKTVALTLEWRDFACFDDHLNTWRVEGGEYTLLAGGSSRCLPLEAAVRLEPDATPVRPLSADSHYADVFQDRRSAKAFFDFMVERGFLRADQVTEELEHALSKTFWGFSQHLDMIAGDYLTQEMLAELLNRMNRALAED